MAELVEASCHELGGRLKIPKCLLKACDAATNDATTEPDAPDASPDGDVADGPDDAQETGAPQVSMGVACK